MQGGNKEEEIDKNSNIIFMHFLSVGADHVRNKIQL